MSNYIVEPCNIRNLKQRLQIEKRIRREAYKECRNKRKVKIYILDSCIMCEYPATNVNN